MTHERDQSHALASSETSADRVEIEPGRSSRSSLMRKPDHAIVSGLLQRAARDANGVAEGADSAVAAASSSSSGMALPETLMRKFEGSLGADLSGVRVHTGEASAAANHAVGAKAYTMGNDIHFGAGQYDPSSPSGEHLLAHEVAHTVQQSGGAQRMQFKLEVSSPGDHLEHEADHAASAMVSGAAAHVSLGTGVNRKVMRDALDYQKWIPAKSTTSEVDVAGNKASAKAGELPMAQIPTAFATSRANYFDRKLQELMKSDIPGVAKADLGSTNVAESLEKQKSGYLADVNAIENINAQYNDALPQANFAAKALARNLKLRASLGFSSESKTVFQDNLDAKQQGALAASVKKHPDSLPGTQNLALLAKNVDSSRQKLNAAKLAYKNWVIGGVVAELNKALEEANAKKEEIEAEIKKATQIAGLVMKGVELVASGGTAIGKVGVEVEEGLVYNKTAAKIGEGAEYASKADGAVDALVEFGMTLYHQKDLDALNAQIKSATSSITAMHKCEAVNEAEKNAEALGGAISAYAAACGTLEQGVSDRRKAYAVLAKEADDSLAGGKKGGDSVSQVMLYMSSVRETKSLLDGGLTGALAALGKIEGGRNTMSEHRSEGYWTAENFYGPQNVDDDQGPDQKAMSDLRDVLNAWIANAKDEKAVLDTQDASASTLMSSMGSGNY